MNKYVTQRKLALLSVALTAALSSRAQMSPPLAPTPPMGWNSWDSYGTTVTEAEVRANADYMASKLARYGWKYIVVDIEWYTPKPPAHGDYIPDQNNVTIDAYGRFTPAVGRFPSAADGNGFRSLGDYIHSKGLAFGIHIMRGISRKAVDENLPILGSTFHAGDIADKKNVCTWGGMQDTYGVDMTKPGAQAYYDSIVALYASWGVDYIKADDMSHPFHGDEIQALHEAISKSGRRIVLSLSPGPSPVDQASTLRKNAQLWRISADFWDRWNDVNHQFDLTHAWEGFTGPDSWPDADMLPLGRIAIRGENGTERRSRLTHDEQQTLMTLWSIFRSPLMFGGDLPSNDDFTMSLLSNSEVLAVNQSSQGGHELLRKGNLVAWTALSADKRITYLAVFNRGDVPLTGELALSDVGIRKSTVQLHNLWTKGTSGSIKVIPTDLAPHASAFYALR